MNYNTFAEKAHKAACDKGFWDNPNSNEHALMLVITEVSEMVEADRKGKHADKHGFEVYTKNADNFNIKGNLNVDAFKECVKDTVEDELADVAIRLADLAGKLGVNFDKMQPCRYYRAFAKFTFTENAFAFVKGMCRDGIAIEKRIQFGLDYAFNWAKSLDIDLYWHVARKMEYNASRPTKHGKAY